MELGNPTPETRIAIQTDNGQPNFAYKDVPSQLNNGQAHPSNINGNQARVVHPRPLPVYAPRRTKNFVARRCDPLIRLFKWFPVLFITAVLSWGYYAYVVQLCYRKYARPSIIK